MKKAAAIMLLLMFLSGCHSPEFTDQALALREQVLSGESCSFECTITADYSDRLYTFAMTCSFDKSGNMMFSVLEPKTISGISGTVDSKGGNITFDDQALFFELMADGYLSPVTTPWVFMKTLRSGYIDGCTEYDGGFYLSIDDSYQEKPLKSEVWMDEDHIPIRAELLWEGRRILSMDVRNFSCV